MKTEFVISVGTLPGAEHRRLSCNNQDGLAVRRGGGALVAAVTDGCSEGRFSEVGARLAAGWLAADGLALIEEGGLDDLPERLCDALLARLEALAPARVRAAFVAEYLLFTCLVAAVTDDRVLVFGLGDGVVACRRDGAGSIAALDAGVDNAPPYLGYRLLDPALLSSDPGALAPAVHLDGPADFDALLIGTDGLPHLPEGALEGLLADPAHARNPSLLQKRLRASGRSLPDDTTAVLLRRAP